MKKLKSKIYNLLRWSERYTKTDMVYLASGGFWLTLGKVISTIAAFGLSVAFANLLPQKDFGTYKYILSIFSILTVTTLPGMDTAVTRAVAKGTEGIFTKAFKTKVKWGLLGSLASIGVAIYYFIQGNAILSILFFVAAFFVPLFDSLTLYSSVLAGKKLFKTNIFYNTAIQVSATLLLLGTLFATNSVLFIILVYFAGYTLLRSAFFVRAQKYRNKKAEGDKTTIPFGKHLSFMKIIGTIANQLDKILLWQFLGAAPLAIYSFAIAPVTQAVTLLRSTTTLAFPKLAEQKKEELKKTLPLKLFKFALLLLVLVVLYILAAPYIFDIFFPKYTEAVVYSQIFAISIFLFPQRIFSTTLSAHAKTKHLYIANIVGVAVKISAILILIPLYGLMGAIIALLVPSFLNVGLNYFLFRKM